MYTRKHICSVVIFLSFFLFQIKSQEDTLSLDSLNINEFVQDSLEAKRINDSLSLAIWGNFLDSSKYDLLFAKNKRIVKGKIKVKDTIGSFVSYQSLPYKIRNELFLNTDTLIFVYDSIETWGYTNFGFPRDTFYLDSATTSHYKYNLLSDSMFLHFDSLHIKPKFDKLVYNDSLVHYLMNLKADSMPMPDYCLCIDTTTLLLSKSQSGLFRINEKDTVKTTYKDYMLYDDIPVARHIQNIIADDTTTIFIDTIIFPSEFSDSLFYNIKYNIQDTIQADTLSVPE